MNHFKRIREIVKCNASLYLILLSIIVISDDCYWFSTSTNTTLVALKYGFFVLLPFYIYKKYKVHNINLGRIILMSLFFCMSAVLGGASVIGGPATLFFLLLSSELVVKSFSMQVFSKVFINVVNTIMLYAIVVWTAVMMDLIHTTDVENIEGTSIKVALLCTFFSDYFGVLLRNGAIFREPGIFMVFINIAFILETLYLRSKMSVGKLVLYVGCMLTTLSTAGLIILFLSYILYCYNQKTNIKAFAIPVVFMAVCVYLLMSSEELLGDIFSKFDRGMDSGSVAGRITSLTIPTMIILHNPLFGVGAAMFRNEYILYAKQLYNTTIDPQGLATNTILNAGAVYGLWFSLFIILNFFKLSKAIVIKNKIQSFYIFILLMMMFSNESMFYSMIVYILIYYGIYANNKLLRTKLQ